MPKIPTFDLISGKSRIKINEACSIKVPTLGDIRNIGYESYEQYINIIALDLHQYLRIIDAEDRYGQLTNDEKKVLTIFNVLVSGDETRKALSNALSFFVYEDVKFDEGRSCFLLFGRGEDYSDRPPQCVGVIHSDNYESVRDAVLQISYITNSSPELKKFKSPKAQKIYEKIMKGRAEKKQSKTADRNMSLANIIGAMSVHHPGYNLTNIWSLTIYQLYDQFSRLNIKIQVDIVGLRWAAWGKEPFDFTFWYQDINKNR